MGGLQKLFCIHIPVAYELDACQKRCCSYLGLLQAVSGFNVVFAYEQTLLQ